jgi:hypothetical protein
MVKRVVCIGGPFEIAEVQQKLPPAATRFADG